MTFDTYNNCGFQCLYCFSSFQKAVGLSKDAYLNKKITNVNPEAIKRMFEGETKSQFSEYIKDRKVMQWGGINRSFLLD